MVWGILVVAFIARGLSLSRLILSLWDESLKSASVTRLMVAPTPSYRQESGAPFSSFPFRSNLRPAPNVR